jgi:hypothetical protein
MTATAARHGRVALPHVWATVGDARAAATGPANGRG